MAYHLLVSKAHSLRSQGMQTYTMIPPLTPPGALASEMDEYPVIAHPPWTCPRLYTIHGGFGRWMRLFEIQNGGEFDVDTIANARDESTRSDRQGRSVVDWRSRS